MGSYAEIWYVRFLIDIKTNEFGRAPPKEQFKSVSGFR